jgi:hypothetical protein
MYPKPDRSNIIPNFVKTPENDALDLGWAEGVLSDGRPFRAECWAQDQITMLTLFFSVMDLENHTDQMFKDMLIKESLIEFVGDDAFLQAATIKDAAGNDMWSVNIVIGTEDGLYVRDSVGLKSHQRKAT